MWVPKKMLRDISQDLFRKRVLKKRKRAAEEDLSRDEIQTLNWQNRVRVAPKKRPGKHSPKKG